MLKVAFKTQREYALPPAQAQPGKSPGKSPLRRSQSTAQAATLGDMPSRVLIGDNEKAK